MATKRRLAPLKRSGAQRGASGAPAAAGASEPSRQYLPRHLLDHKYCSSNVSAAERAALLQSR